MCRYSLRMEDFVYLASASPRRRQLLSQIGVSFQVLSVDVDESIAVGEGAEGYVLRLARAKAAAGLARRIAGRRAAVPSGAVVWVTRGKAHRPIELLGDQDAHEGVGQRERRQ